MTGTDNNVFGDGFETTPQEEQDIYNHKTSYSGKAPRRWLNIFINSSIHYNKTFTDNREFTSFDMFPTILASMGCKINGDRLGLGVNLFSGMKTLIERYDEETLNRELMTNNTVYALLEGRVSANRGKGH